MKNINSLQTEKGGSDTCRVFFLKNELKHRGGVRVKPHSRNIYRLFTYLLMYLLTHLLDGLEGLYERTRCMKITIFFGSSF